MNTLCRHAVLRYYGTTVLRYYGTTVLRYYGTKVPAVSNVKALPRPHKYSYTHHLFPQKAHPVLILTDVTARTQTTTVTSIF